ncbi:MAG: helix-turn-helix transcriptional regulator [Lysobacterales bacterium]
MKTHEDIRENRLIRKPEVRACTGMTASALDREIKAGRFPKPVKLSGSPEARAVGWSMRQVQQWIAEREAQVAA